MSTTLTPDRLTAVDLTDLPNENMAALRREAIRRGISIAQLVADEMRETSQRLVDATAPKPPTTTDIITGAVNANRPNGGQSHHDTPQPEGLN